MKVINNTSTIVDVRTPQEFLSEHVSNAINIPLDEVEQRINEFKKMAKPIMAYCKSGNRSGMAVAILRRNGITEVVNGGGVDDVKQLIDK